MFLEFQMSGRCYKIPGETKSDIDLVSCCFMQKLVCKGEQSYFFQLSTLVAEEVSVAMEYLEVVSLFCQLEDVF